MNTDEIRKSKTVKTYCPHPEASFKSYLRSSAFICGSIEIRINRR
jgi:hypothetical protein